MSRFPGLAWFGVLACLMDVGAARSQTEGGANVTPQELLAVHSMVGGTGRSLYRTGNPPVWSPDGERIVFAGRGRVWEVPAAGGTPSELPFRGSQVAFAPTGGWLAYVSGASGSPEVWLWSEGEGRSAQLTNLGFRRIKSMNWSPDGRWIVFSANRYGTFDVWKVGVPAGEVHRLTRDARYEVSPTWSPDGAAILFVRMDDRWLDRDVLEIPADGGPARVVVRETDFFDYGGGSDFGEPLVSPDGESVLFRSYQSGWLNYRIVPRGGGPSRAIAPEEADQRSAVWSPDGRHVAVTSLHNGTHQIRVVVPGGETRALVRPEFGFIKDVQWAPDGQHISYVMSTPVQAQELYVAAVEDGQARRLTVSLPDRSLERRLARPEKVFYPSADGYRIPAYLYRPPGLEPGERAPALMRVHGGPTHQYYDHFERHVQFFVHQGYVVLLPNIRGSSGYGRAWEDANNACWARCDMRDVVAGAEYLRSLPFVEGENLGLWGRSYGAFMAMGVVAFAPGVFKASIAYGGYSDWEYYQEHGGPSSVRLLEYELGAYPEAAAVYRYSSPIHFLKDAVTPTFVIEGGVRRRHYGEGTEPRADNNLAFVREMERLDKPVQYRAYPRWSDGDVPYPGEEEAMWNDMLAFFDRYLRDGVLQPAGVLDSP